MAFKIILFIILASSVSQEVTNHPENITITNTTNKQPNENTSLSVIKLNSSLPNYISSTTIPVKNENLVYRKPMFYRKAMRKQWQEAVRNTTHSDTNSSKTRQGIDIKGAQFDVKLYPHFKLNDHFAGPAAAFNRRKDTLRPRARSFAPRVRKLFISRVQQRPRREMTEKEVAYFMMKVKRREKHQQAKGWRERIKLTYDVMSELLCKITKYAGESERVCKYLKQPSPPDLEILDKDDEETLEA